MWASCVIMVSEVEKFDNLFFCRLSSNMFNILYEVIWTTKTLPEAQWIQDWVCNLVLNLLTNCNTFYWLQILPPDGQKVWNYVSLPSLGKIWAKLHKVEDESNIVCCQRPFFRIDNLFGPSLTIHIFLQLLGLAGKLYARQRKSNKKLAEKTTLQHCNVAPPDVQMKTSQCYKSNRNW